jgi:hypothetical protein
MTDREKADAMKRAARLTRPGWHSPVPTGCAN